MNHCSLSILLLATRVSTVIAFSLIESGNNTLDLTGLVGGHPVGAAVLCNVPLDLTVMTALPNVGDSTAHKARSFYSPSPEFE